MTEQTQQDFLRAAKATLGLKWDDFAVKAEVKPRSFKNYRLPDTEVDHRALPAWVRKNIQALLDAHEKARAKEAKRAERPAQRAGSV